MIQTEHVRDVCVDSLYKSTYTLLYFTCGKTGIWDLIGILSFDTGIRGLDLDLGYENKRFEIFHIRLGFEICSSPLATNVNMSQDWRVLYKVVKIVGKPCPR